MRRTMFLFAALATLTTLPVRSQAPESSVTLDEVVVTGEQPGPGLWKLTRDGRTLWVLATVTPKPRDITWRSKQVGDVLNDTQEVIDQQLQGWIWPANIDLDVASINPLAGLRAWRKAEKLQKELPPTPPLRETLPPDVYDRYVKLKAIYLPRDSAVETLRPRSAANRLYNAAINAKGLSTRAMIHDEVHKLARKRGVKVSEMSKEYEFDLDTMIKVNMEFSQMPAETELACFVETIEDLERNLPLITERANAWATGNVDKLRQLPFLRREACDKAYWSASRWTNLRNELETFWIERVEKSVAKNKSTMVLLDMAELLQPDGLLDALTERGFKIDEAP